MRIELLKQKTGENEIQFQARVNAFIKKVVAVDINANYDGKNWFAWIVYSKEYTGDNNERDDN